MRGKWDNVCRSDTESGPAFRLPQITATTAILVSPGRDYALTGSEGAAFLLQAWKQTWGFSAKRLFWYLLRPMALTLKSEMNLVGLGQPLK